MATSVFHNRVTPMCAASYVGTTDASGVLKIPLASLYISNIPRVVIATSAYNNRVLSYKYDASAADGANVILDVFDCANNTPLASGTIRVSIVCWR